ncbi:MAG: HEAT repeat domain-containing protein [Planctomycetota bacterium]
MNKTSVLGAAVLAGALVAPSFGHGGTYRGPGDTVPPPGGGAGGPAGAAPPPSAGPAAPSSPGPSSPGAPAPASPGAAPAAPGASGPTTGAGPDLGADLSLWDFWWGFNKEPYLNLRARVRAVGVQSGSDDLFLGRGTQLKTQGSLRPTQDQIRNEVVPALKWALENEEQNDIITGALIALAKIGDVSDADGKSEFVEIISGFLKSPEQEISETAALALGILADDRAVPNLVGLMLDDKTGRALIERDVPFRTRTFAAYGLGLVGYTTATNEMRQTISEHIVDFLQGPSLAQPDMKVGAVQAIGLIPLDWDSTIEAEENSNAAYVANRRALLEYLYMKTDPVKRGAEGGFDDHRVRAQTPVAIARLMTNGEEVPEDLDELRGKIVERFIKLANNRQERVEVRQSATIALGMIGDAGDSKTNKTIFKALEKIAKDSPDPQSEFFGVMAIAQMGSRKGAGDDPRALQEDAEDFLTKALAQGKGQKAPWSALALGVFGNALIENDGAISTSLKSAIREKFSRKKSPVERGAYAVALGLIKDGSSEELLLDALEKIGSGQDEVRGHICVGLGLMEATTANEKLNDLVKNSKYRPDLLKSAAIGLGLLGDKSAVGVLVEMLKDAPGLSSQAAIATALGTIGDTNAVTELVRVVRNEADQEISDVARGFACAALGITCDKETFPWNTKIAVNANYRANVRTLTSPDNGDGILDIL